MKVFLVSVALLGALCSAWPAQDVAEAAGARVKRGHHEHATSYQNFNLESYHPVPVYKDHHETSHHEPQHKISADFELSSHDFGSSLEGHGHEALTEGGDGYSGLGLLGGHDAHDSTSFLHDGDEGGFSHLGDAEEEKEDHHSY